MKISIEKSGAVEKIRVAVTTDTSKRPIEASLTKEQAAMLVSLLQQAIVADRFTFYLEL